MVDSTSAHYPARVVRNSRAHVWNNDRHRDHQPDHTHHMVDQPPYASHNQFSSPLNEYLEPVENCDLAPARNRAHQPSCSPTRHRLQSKPMDRMAFLDLFDHIIVQHQPIHQNFDRHSHHNKEPTAIQSRPELGRARSLNQTTHIAKRNGEIPLSVFIRTFLTIPHPERHPYVMPNHRGNFATPISRRT